MKTLTRAKTIVDARTLLMIGLAVLLSSPTAFAHKISVFAWIEGDMVHTQSKFMGGKGVRNAKVFVYDTEDKTLTQGETDNTGKFSFPIPAKHPMNIVVDAGSGHRGEWAITAEDISEAFPEMKAAVKTMENEQLSTTVAAKNKDNPPPPDRVTEALIQAAVEKAVKKELSPVISRLNRQLDKNETGLTDILGGLGYICGLMGIAAYVHFRRKEKK